MPGTLDCAESGTAGQDHRVSSGKSTSCRGSSPPTDTSPERRRHRRQVTDQRVARSSPCAPWPANPCRQAGAGSTSSSIQSIHATACTTWDLPTCRFIPSNAIRCDEANRAGSGPPRVERGNETISTSAAMHAVCAMIGGTGETTIVTDGLSQNFWYGRPGRKSRRHRLSQRL